MESISNLIELLKSQLAFYTEVRDALAEEKRAIVEWKFKDTTVLTRKKEAFAYKEKILEEARKSLAERIAREYGAKDRTLYSIMEVCPDAEKKAVLSELRDDLGRMAVSINDENMSLKILYSTNIRLINDLYSAMGYSPTNKYGMEKRPPVSSMSALG